MTPAPTPMSNPSPLEPPAPSADDTMALAEHAGRTYRFGLTPLGARKLYESLHKRGTPDAALRVGVRGGGCSGFSYVLEFADGEPRSRDLVFRYPVPAEGGGGSPGDVKVYCDKKSIIYLNGAALEWSKTLMYQGFQFSNPQEKSSCGCNESFSV
ncbi:MAG: iron-sulfur cluster assembly accessory protein [Myxococcota bacterium]